MEDWEDVQIPPLLSKEHPRKKWDDEDDVKESWEDEDEPTPAPVVKHPPEKAPKKSTAKTTEKKGKTVEVVKQEKLDALAEKLHQQRLVEEADFRSTIELFAKKGDEKSLDSFIPKSESDFLEYAELISHKLRTFEVKREFGSFDKYWWGYVNLKPISTQYKSCQKIPMKTSKLETISKDMVKRGFIFVGPTVLHSFMQAGGLSNDHYIGLLKAIIRLSTIAMKAADAKEVSASVTAIANEKIKLRKKPTLAKRSKLGRENSFMLNSPKMIWWLIPMMLLMTMILCNLFR